jgi:hypothetical protein
MSPLSKKKSKGVSPYKNPIPIWKFWAKHPNDANRKTDSIFSLFRKKKKSDPLGVTKRR